MIFNSLERKGAVILLFLVTGAFVLPRQFRGGHGDFYLLPAAEAVQEDTVVPAKAPPAGATRTVAWKRQPQPVVELNAADSAQLVRVRGIGPYYAGKILRYRERLGGFHSVRQLKEVNMTYFNVDSAAHCFRADTALIVRRELDTMSFKSILRHPYLEYEDVRMMFEAKRKFGRMSVAVLEENGVLPAYKLKKIKPYFK